MSTDSAPLEHIVRLGRESRRADRRRLARQDALSARVAELVTLRELVSQAAEVVRRGWVQGAWFRVAGPAGTRLVTAYDVGLATSRPVAGACLVGGVVQAGGGPAAAHGQPVQRALDLTWHTLREAPDRRVRWCPGPDVRRLHVLDLTRWNDAPGRTREQVVDLLEAAALTAEVQRDRCRAELGALAH